jgi:hypothetical protein
VKDGVVLLLLLWLFSSSSSSKGPVVKSPGWPKPPPDEDLGVHPLPPNPLKK